MYFIKFSAKIQNLQQENSKTSLKLRTINLLILLGGRKVSNSTSAYQLHQ
jgi:hypothetical protein